MKIQSTYLYDAGGGWAAPAVHLAAIFPSSYQEDFWLLEAL